jgi:uncharacterized protein DUF3604
MRMKIKCVIPSNLKIGETFSIKVKIIGDLCKIPCTNEWNTKKPCLKSPFNLAVSRNIQYFDNVFPEWNGKLHIDGNRALKGPDSLSFNDKQGVFPEDVRPIKTFPSFQWFKPGFHFVRLTDPVSGATALSNPVYVSEKEPDNRIYWGDPHWQTFFTDGIRCPEELYAFARDEAFLDFGAISDHSEGLTDRQWDYFQAVSNDYNQTGSFATLIGQEWTNHKFGHRNIYYREKNGPIFRSDDLKYNSLDKLWKGLDDYTASGNRALAIPHHTSNKIMGCDWSYAWNDKYEKAVEIYSIWGNSECSAENGNLYPLRHCGGEVDGKHVYDALKKGFRFGFIGGGDIHDGRPGESLAYLSPLTVSLYPQGLTAIYSPELTRENVFDAISNHATYATTSSRIYLEFTQVDVSSKQIEFDIKCASEEGLAKIEIIRNGVADFLPALEKSSMTFLDSVKVSSLSEGEFIYLRVTTDNGNMAWSSPIFQENQLL